MLYIIRILFCFKNNRLRLIKKFRKTNIEKNMDYIFMTDSLVLVTGLLSNTIGLLTILLSKKLANIGARFIYIFLFIVDSAFLALMLVDRIAFYRDYDIMITSVLVCKVYAYLYRIIASMSPMLLTYITVEKYFSLEDLARRFVLRVNRNQIIYLVSVILFNAIYYSPYLIFYELNSKQQETLNGTILAELKCEIVEPRVESIMQWMDLMSRVIIPAIIMTIATIFLIVSVHNSIESDELSRISTATHGVSLKLREIRFAITSISLNTIYVCLTLPLPVFLICKCVSELKLYLSFYMFCFTYCVNFYVLIISNKLFRNEFIKLFNKNYKGVE